MKFSKTLWPLAFCASVFIISASATAEDKQPLAELSNLIPTKADTHALERKKYLAAQNALNAKRTQEFQKLLQQLDGYPLLPYLEFEALKPKLASLPTKSVEQFLQKYPDSLVSDRLLQRWLLTLAQQKKWDEFNRFYDARMADTDLACLSLQARLATKDETAFDEVARFWNVEDTQTKTCDPVFAKWTAAGRMTPELIWDRHLKVVKAGNMGLAKYLTKLLPTDEQELARLLENVRANPKLLKQKKLFSKQSTRMQQVILYGLERYAREDASDALKLWQAYDAQQLFSDEDRINLKYQIALRLLHDDQDLEAERLVASTPNLTRVDLIEWFIRESLRKQDWEKVNEWITQLPLDAQKTERWRYWQARTMEVLDIKEINGESPESIYASIATTRSFYGFLASDKTGIDYHLLDRPVTFTPEQLARVEINSGIQRAKEFYLMGNMTAASREWFYTTQKMPASDVAIAGRLAGSWGWYRQGIQAMIDSNYWDDLEMRFPIVFQEHVTKAAKNTSVNPLLIFAVARQESAFRHDARSPAGAMGLMQLMPATARHTAKQYGIKFTNNDLLTPEKNITLGSHYLDQLLNQFNGNRILAAAAYNAGPNRVKQWLNKDSADQLPYDVWIETIPFKETRGYVQNVLSFSVIYAYRLGKKQTVITTAEATQQL